MLSSITPGIVFIDDKYINVEYICNTLINGLSIQLDYFSGDKELLQFGSELELDKAIHKLNAAQLALDFGTNYVPR
jgi:hypothetical protein